MSLPTEACGITRVVRIHERKMHSAQDSGSEPGSRAFLPPGRPRGCERHFAGGVWTAFPRRQRPMESSYRSGRCCRKSAAHCRRNSMPGDGFLGEEVGEVQGTTGRRWIVDGIDGTRSFAAGYRMGTLIALESMARSFSGSHRVRLKSAGGGPRGVGAFSGHPKDRLSGTRLHVSTERGLNPDRFITLPVYSDLSCTSGGSLKGWRAPPPDRPWSHQNRIAEGDADVCVWFCGGIRDHAASSSSSRKLEGDLATT